MNRATGSGTRYRSGRPAAARSRTTEEETPNSGISSIVARSSAPRLRITAATSASEIPARRATAETRQLDHPLGLRQLSSPTAASAPITNTSSLSPFSCKLLQGLIR